MSALPLIHNRPPDWQTTWNLAEQLKEIKARPTFLYDPTSSPMKAIAFQNYSAADGSFGVNGQGILVTAVNYVRNFAGGYEVTRTPVVYKNNVCAAAPATTDIWAPTAGKKFRVLGGFITMSGLIAAAATRNIQLVEETAGTVIMQASVTIPVLGFNLCIPFNLRPNGYLSSTVTKKLQAVTSGGTYTTGVDSVSVWGTEE